MEPTVSVVVVVQWQLTMTMRSERSESSLFCVALSFGDTFRVECKHILR